jgi:NDP-sugar pyrophosphorylase family protein
MIAVIPSAGTGGRLYPYTKKIPKVMVKINGKPLIQYHIEDLKRNEVDTFLINLHHLPEVITEYLGNGEKFGVKIYYSYEKKLLGTAGLLNNFRQFLTSSFWFVAGDIFLSNFNFKKMQEFHRDKKSLLTIALKERLDRLDTDFAEFDKNFKITRIYPRPHKKIPKSRFDTCMIYFIEPQILHYLPKNGFCDFSLQFLPNLVSKKLPIYGYVTSEFIEDVGTPERYNKIKTLVKTLV